MQWALKDLLCWIFGFFPQYSVSLSEPLPVSMASSFKFSCHFKMRISSINNISGSISITIFFSCYLLNFWFYVQFDQFDKEKQNIKYLYRLRLFNHKVISNRIECSFSQNHYRDTNLFYSIQPLYITWNTTHDVLHNSKKLI